MKPTYIFLLLAFTACAASAESSYTRYTAGNVDVCDLKSIDTFDFFGAAGTSKQSYLNAIEAKGWLSDVKTVDINITHCPHTEHPYHGDEAIRVYVGRDEMKDGFSLSYDLYFDEADELSAIEGRHLYIER